VVDVGREGEAVVGDAVAVVVEAVAGLGRGPRAALADEHAAAAKLRAERALAGVDAARGAALRVALVDAAVAVVVLAVARLGGRHRLSDAGERAAGAAERPRRADADVAAAEAAAVGVALVDRAVAVVVGAVAGLGRGVGAARAHERAAD